MGAMRFIHTTSGIFMRRGVSEILIKIKNYQPKDRDINEIRQMIQGIDI